MLLDIERIAPCMPGATLESIDGDDFKGTVKVKVGPISLTYKGDARFVEKDAVSHRAVIEARGRDTRGNGTAAAKVTATLTSERATTRVHVLTDLDITGKPAQFGRGIMVDVGNKLIERFADCLAGKLSEAAYTPDAGESSPAATAQEHHAASQHAPRLSSPVAAEPLNLMQSAGPAIAKRVLPMLVVLTVAAIAVWRWWRS